LFKRFIGGYKKRMVRGIKKRYEGVENNTLDKEKDKAQYETYILLTQEYLTPLEVAKKRGVNVSAVYKTIEKLKKKGLIKGVEKGGIIKGGEYLSTPPKKDKFRMSALAYTIEILKVSERYKKLLEKRNIDQLDNNTLSLFKDKIVIYLNKDFFGMNENECSIKSFKYILKFLTIVENNYKIVLQTAKKRNLKEFRCEIEKLDDPHAKKKRIEKKKLKIKDLEDGKTRIITDYSFKRDSIEAVKNQKSRKDINRIEYLWNDLLDNDIGLSELAVTLDKQNHIVNELIEHNISQQKFSSQNMVMMRELIKFLREIDDDEFR